MRPCCVLIKRMDWHLRFTQQAAWTQELRRFVLAQTGLAPGARLLEVGSGTGAVLSALAGDGWSELYGLDIERSFLRQAAVHASEAQFVAGDAHYLPYADGSFDACLCHFLLLWVSSPSDALLEMIRVTRPGGFVIALAEPDYGGRVDYPPEMAALGELQAIALSRRGAETRMGRRLAALFHGAGLQAVQTGVLGGQWTGQPDRQAWEAEWAVVEADLEDVIPQEKLQRYKEQDAAAWKRGERVLFVPTFWAIGQVK